VERKDSRQFAVSSKSKKIETKNKNYKDRRKKPCLLVIEATKALGCETLSDAWFSRFWIIKTRYKFSLALARSEASLRISGFLKDKS